MVAYGGGVGCKNFREIKNKKLMVEWREISHGFQANKPYYRRWR
jgi:hypothetical protein